MTNEEHKKEVNKLYLIEDDLIKLIFEVGNEDLQNKFNEWQDQRSKCNQGFINWIREISNEKSSAAGN